MKTAGEILKEKRLEKNLSLSDIEKATRIREKFLKAIEEDNFSLVPGFTYLYGFVGTVAQYLGLPKERVLAVLRRQYEEKKIPVLPKGIEKPLLPNAFLTKVSIPITFIFALIILFVFVYFQYKIFNSSPKLVIDYPDKEITVKTDDITVKGSTNKDSRIFINGQEISVNENGSFSANIKISQGSNKLIIVAVSKKGKETKVEKEVQKQ